VSSSESVAAPCADAVLVCGLGRVGRECIKALRGYRVPVRSIDRHLPTGIALEPGSFTHGDFREPETLQRAGIGACRAIVLVAGDSAANIEGALAARRANPHIRLVVRGERQSWHDLLSQQLGNLVVYEPNRLSAAALAFATLDGEVLAHFYVDDELFQVVEHRVLANERSVGLPVEALPMPRSQVLIHVPAQAPAHPRRASAFYGWSPEQTLAVDDRVLLLTTGRPRPTIAAKNAQPEAQRSRAQTHWLRNRFERLGRPETIALSSVGVLLTLLIGAVAGFAWGSPHLPPHEALRLALMLLTGGHLADVFVDFEHLPAQVQWIEILLTVTGTLLTAVLYALLTDRLLTARFALLTRRPRAPTHAHVIVAGLGATGERVASVLQDLQQPVLGIEKDPVDIRVLPKLPILQGSATDPALLQQAGLESALGLVAATAEDLQNVEIALLASSLNPQCRVAVRTFDPRLTENVSALLPNARILCVSSLAATAYAAAALGEHVIGLFQAHDTPVLVVEYHVAAGDTLCQRPLWEVAEGYAVVPVLHQPRMGQRRVLTPEDAGLALEQGDRLVVLATAASLEAIERGDLRRPEYELWIEQLRPYAEPLQLVGLLAQRLGYTLERARDVLGHLPHCVPRRLYGLYGHRTQRALRASGLQSSLRLVTANGATATTTTTPRPQSSARDQWTSPPRP
jgi:Trk K+ transport system NAD-binding subunit